MSTEIHSCNLRIHFIGNSVEFLSPAHRLSISPPKTKCMQIANQYFKIRLNQSNYLEGRTAYVRASCAGVREFVS